MLHLCAENLIEVGLKETTKTTLGLGFLISLFYWKKSSGILRKLAVC